MSNYTKSTNFATKDNLTPGDPLKVVRGTEIDTEFNNISTAIATKTDNSAAAITGGAIDGATVGATTPATGAFTTLAASGTTTLAGALVGAATQSAFNTVSTTLNLGGAATALNLGAATGTATVNNTTLAAKAITASTTLAVTGTSTLTGAVTATAGVSGPITSSSVSITGGSITGITDLAVADGGTGASTAAGGLNNLLPSQTGNASKYLQTDGTNASWDAVSLSTADITGTLGAANGGTGVSNNAAMTVTGSGNFAYTRTLTGTTNVTFPTTGTLATLAGTETLTNKTLTSPILTTPTLGVATGTSFQGIIGNVTPAAGSFTTLGASSTATLNTLSSSGATLTGGTINGMTVGATTASSGAFTTVTASTAIGTTSGGTGLTSFTANGVVYASSSSALATSSALTFDGTTVGIGPQGTSGQLVVADAITTVVAANQDRRYRAALKIGSNFYGGEIYGGLNSSGSQTFNIGVYDGTSTSTVSAVFQANNTKFYASGSEALTLTSTSLYTASGINVGIGTSSPSARIEAVAGTGSQFIGTFRTGDATAANNIGGGFYGVSSATAGSRQAMMWLDADGGNFGGGDYFYINKLGNSGDVALIQQSSAAMTFQTSATERARIDSSGTLSLRDAPASNALQFGTTSGGIYSEAARMGLASGALTFFVGSTVNESARIDSSGNLLVGQTSGGARLNITAAASQNGVNIVLPSDNYLGATIHSTATSGDNQFAAFGTEASFTTRGSISYNRAGGLTAYNTTSDYRAKDISGPVTGSGALIDSVPVYMGKMKGATQERPMFIAHETPAYAHTGEKDAVDADGNPVYQQMDASALIPVMWAEIQSLRQRLSAANL